MIASLLLLPALSGAVDFYRVDEASGPARAARRDGGAPALRLPAPESLSDFPSLALLFDGSGSRAVPVDAAPSGYDFASRFTSEDLSDPVKRDAFLREVMRWEGRFHQPGLAYNGASGLTYDGHDLDPVTLQPKPGGARRFTAASKESLQVALLSKSLAGDRYAQAFVPPATAAEILALKIASYEKFNKEYPGFGGFQPWVGVSDEGMRPLPEWQDRVPALDNGELAWTLMGAVEALRAAGKPALAARYQAQLDLMARNAGRMFFDPRTRKIRAEASIPDPSAAPERQVYGTPNAGYVLDDPFEGELFVLFWSLYGKAPADQVRDVWAGKAPKPLDVATARGVITVRRGWEFSSHEEWNLLVAPYLDEPLVRRVIRNNQRLRTAYSAERGVNALFAAAHAPVYPLSYRNYGIPGAGTENSKAEAAVPYAAFPVMMTDPAVGLAWYRAMLAHPNMQGPYGGGEAGEIGGSAVAPVLTWDGKETAVLAAVGGAGDLSRRYLRRTGREKRFRALLADTYRRGFDGVPLRGENLPLALPPL